MTMRLILLALFVLLPIIEEAHGERRILSAPSRVVFSAKNHMSAEYRGLVNSFCELAAESASREHTDVCLSLETTLNQGRLLSTVRQLQSRLLESTRLAGRNVDPLVSKLLEVLRAIETKIDSGRYVLSVPVEFSVDEEAREYRLHWRKWLGADRWSGSWSGDLVTRRVKFIPMMRLTVRGFYQSSDGGAFGYEVRTGAGSEGSASEIWIEALGLTTERLRRLASSRMYHKRSNVTYAIRPPGRGYLQDFRLQCFDVAEYIVTAGPEERLSFPPLVKVPWQQLPGVVKCWVGILDFPYPIGMDSEVDPADLSEMFSGFEIVNSAVGRKKVPRAMYHGKTIGPVPIPERDHRQAFASKIREYFQEALYWGWASDAELAGKIDDQLGELRRDPSDRQLVAGVLKEIEAGHQSEQLLEEAYILLKYNLEYLADDGNWSDPN